MKKDSTTVRINKFKAISFIMALIVTAITVFALLPPQKASAEGYKIAFPLPSDKSYQVSVFDTYSWGAPHYSYIAEWVLHKGNTLPSGQVMDIPAKCGTEVYALADGVVYHNYCGPKSGNLVLLKHTYNDSTYYSYYGHLRYKSKLKVGSTVKAGDLIGYVGMTGESSGYHLHFETTLIDPYCTFKNLMGIDISIMPNSGASVYPHEEHYRSDNRSTAGNREEVNVQNGTYRIFSANSDYCVDVYRGNTSSVEDGRNVQLFPENFSGAQVFKITKQSDGWYTIQHVYTGKMLDMNSDTGNVYMWTANGSDYQKWKFYTNGDGYYLLHKASGLYLDVTGDAYFDENNIQGWSQNTSSAQRFYLVPETVAQVRGTDGSLVVHSKKNYYNSSASGYVYEGQIVTVEKREGSFAYIRYGTNSGGWVCGRYVVNV